MEPVKLCDWQRKRRPLSRTYRTAKLEEQIAFVRVNLVPNTLDRERPLLKHNIMIIDEFDVLSEKVPVYEIESEGLRFTMYSDLDHWVISCELKNPVVQEFHFALPVPISPDTCPHMPENRVFDRFHPGMSTFTIILIDRWDVFTFFRMLGLNREVQS